MTVRRSTKLAKARRVAGRMNGHEAEYATLFLNNRVWKFEAITFRLGDDCRYTPDFMVIAEDDVVEFHEVKGFWRDDAKVKLRVAAEQYPMFRFKAFRRVKKTWQVEHFGLGDAVHLQASIA
jgi:hypothetical protein